MDFRGLGRSGWMSQRSHTGRAVPAGSCYPLTAAFSQGLWDLAKGTSLIPAPT